MGDSTLLYCFPKGWYYRSEHGCDGSSDCSHKFFILLIQFLFPFSGFYIMSIADS